MLVSGDNLDAEVVLEKPIAVEGSGADPAGTYSPTARIGTLIRSHTTPGAVSTRSAAARGKTPKETAS